MGECAGTAAAAADGVEWRSWFRGAGLSAGFTSFGGYEYEVCLKRFRMTAREFLEFFLGCWWGFCGAIWGEFSGGILYRAVYVHNVDMIWGGVFGGERSVDAS